METQARKPEYTRVEEQISSYLSAKNYRTGGQLPPMRKLCTEMKVSMATLRRAILNLEERGILETRHGSGVYITSPERDLVVESEIIASGPGQHTLYVMDGFARGDYSTRMGKNFVINQIIDGSSDVCLARRWGLRQLSFVHDGGGDEAMGRILRGKGKASVLVPSMPFLPYVAELERQGISCVVLGPQGFSSAAHEVRADFFEGGYLAGQHLAELGHRTIMYFGTDPLVGKTTFERHAGFAFAYRRANPAGKLVEMFIPDTPSMKDQENLFREAAERAMARIEEVTAVFIASDQIASVAVPFFLQNGVRIPQKISLVTMDDSRYCLQFTPPWTSVNPNLREAARTATELMVAWAGGQTRPASINIVVRPRLMVRQSCRPVDGR